MSTNDPYGLQAAAKADMDQLQAAEEYPDLDALLDSILDAASRARYELGNEHEAGVRRAVARLLPLAEQCDELVRSW